MSRSIKFRAWGPLSKVMLEWRVIEEDLHEYIDHHSYKLMQYTGLQDKNGAEIYEGDIITNNGVTNDMKRRVFVIEWAVDRARYVANDVRANMQTGVLQWDTNDCEVIGNIYENPELLEPAG